MKRVSLELEFDVIKVIKSRGLRYREVFMRGFEDIEDAGAKNARITELEKNFKLLDQSNNKNLARLHDQIIKMSDHEKRLVILEENQDIERVEAD